MFCHIFGEYLVQHKLLTQNQLGAALDYLQTIRVKLGFIAVAEKLLTQEQVTQINLLQNQLDRRFGDIAVFKGDLTQEQLNYLLSIQGNSYLQFVQAVTELGFMTLDKFNEALAQYQMESGYTTEEMESLKSGDVDRVADVLVRIHDRNCNELARLCLRNINRFISSQFYFGKAVGIDGIEVERMAYQQVKGEKPWFLGFASDSEGLLSVSNLYTKEIYDTLDNAAIEAVQEFINCTNGLYASKIKQSRNSGMIRRPHYCEHCNVRARHEFYQLPVRIKEKEIYILLGMNTELMIEA